MTKLYEEVSRGTIDQLIERFGAVARVKGEIVVIIEPPAGKSLEADEVDALILEHLSAASLKEAVAQVAIRTGISRRKIYTRALSLSGALEK